MQELTNWSLDSMGFCFSGVAVSLQLGFVLFLLFHWFEFG
jgi:hypothetical protein